MARTYHMTWIPSRRGWMKEFRGKKYSVSCRQLSELMGGLVPETKDGSYQAANTWWVKKKAELDEASKPKVRPLLPMEDVVTAILGYQGRLDEQDANTLNLTNACLQAGLNEYPKVIVKIGKNGEVVDCWPENLGPNPSPEERIRAAVTSTAARMVGQLLQGQPLPDHTANLLPPARVQQVQDSVAGIRGEATAPAERTVAANCERWVALQQAKVAGGKLAPDRADCLRIYLNHFRDFLGGTAAIDGMGAQKIESFFQWCIGKVQERQKNKEGKAGWSAVYAKKMFDTARVFVRYLWGSGLIELPRNIDSREFGIRVRAKTIETWTPQEFQTALASATGQLRLHLLLMANCGYTQSDISDLLDTEVDWRAGRVIRKRSKTRDHENVPVVDYLLWPSTFSLLKEYRSGQERALLTESGKPWRRKELVEGKLKKSDNIASNYKWLKKKLGGFKKPLKWLRRMGATLLDSDPNYTRFSEMFLGHSPRGVKNRHYSAPDQKGFDEAIRGLGSSWGRSDPRKKMSLPSLTTACH